MVRKIGYDPILHKLFVIQDGDEKELEYRSDWEQLLIHVACSKEDLDYIEIEIRPCLEDIHCELRGVAGSDKPPISDKPFSSLKPSSALGDDEYKRAILSATAPPPEESAEKPKEKNSSNWDDFPEMALELDFITEGEYWDMKYRQRQHKFPTSLPQPGFLSKRGYTRNTRISPWYFLPARYFDDSPPSSPTSTTTALTSATETLSLESTSSSPDQTAGDEATVENYQITTTEDPDYGATERDVIDDSLGAYNTGDNEREWSACLEFFCVNVEEYKRQLVIKASSATHSTRVPVKKFPGMTVGLFDYQLMGVYNLLRFILHDVRGGFLADEQGLGKTQEMFGVLLLTHNLRRCKADVMEAWNPPSKTTPAKKGPIMKHNARDAQKARSCPYDQKWGFKCYCYHGLTRHLADRLPDGPNVIIAPARNCGPMIRDARSKLDSKAIKVRGYGNDIHTTDKDSKLTSVELASLRSGNATIQSDFVIVVSPESIHKLVSEFSKSKTTFTPGIIMLDEFHQYAAYSGEVNRVLDWLKRLKASSLNSQRPVPLVYLVSGTPIENSPSDLRSALEILEHPKIWSQPNHPLSSATLTHFDDLTKLFDSYTASQSQGISIPPSKIHDYYRRLDSILTKVMVRRLATDSFQSTKLTSLGKLKVNIIDHALPASHHATIQSLANSIPPAANLKSIAVGPPLLLKLRLCGTFPAAATSNFTFSDQEVTHFLTTAAENNPSKTPYFSFIKSGLWTTSSPKLVTISSIISQMLADKARIPGESSSCKKLVLFSPVEAESLLLYLWLITTLKKEGVKAVYVHSVMTSQERQKVIDKFLEVGNAAPNVLVAPTGVCGTGFNLQKAGYLVLTGPTWTRREGRQVFGRVHRVGQRGQVRLWELRGGWNPGERVILGADGGMEVDNGFCEGVGDGGEEEEGGVKVDR
ncbi:P-loop containing nucleoside triphosphate hydrolase protein [Apiosordaria backusii]|uniref:P-loop containing nucleoside triphosphate hydrolase protein n=1 Tax=Apiosordaria backusii TaxID=314023 RepID=A0AA40AIR4_9PEZI|nr:P-loop containing nucleoside triphosphate hydrolase protein [Apiosordaria backusii]